MALTFDDLVAPITDLASDFDGAISSWRWLVERKCQPLLMTALGDMFLEIDSEVYFLNIFEGALDQVARSRDAWKREMQTPLRLEEWFLPGFIAALRKAGRLLKTSEVYSPIIPPVLGGSVSVENYTPSPWRMHLHVLGHIHRQVHGLPPGTAIDKIRVDPL